MAPLRKHLEHKSPQWIRPESTYFITVCAEQRNINHFCNTKVGPKVLDSIRYYHEKGLWFCHLAVLMPDHVHLILNFPENKILSRNVGDWKHWLTHHHAVSWQENFFDHRLRKDESLDHKADYILENPVRAGLISKSEDWPYFWKSER